MARGSRGDHVHVDRNFFARLHAHVLNLAVFHHEPSAFIQRKARGDLVPMLFDSELHPQRAAILFIAFGKKDHVAIQARAGPFQRDHHGEIRDRHPLVVNRSAAIE